MIFKTRSTEVLRTINKFWVVVTHTRQLTLELNAYRAPKGRDTVAISLIIHQPGSSTVILELSFLHRTSRYRSSLHNRTACTRVLRRAGACTTTFRPLSATCSQTTPYTCAHAPTLCAYAKHLCANWPDSSSAHTQKWSVRVRI